MLMNDAINVVSSVLTVTSFTNGHVRISQYRQRIGSRYLETKFEWFGPTEVEMDGQKYHKHQ